MSDSELNVLDLKKILEAHALHKPGMTLIEMKRVYHSFKCKQAIEAEGLYENGMSDQDIKELYDTLKKSEESVGNENEYRELLKQTETNCSNIDMIIEESNTMNDETVDVTSIQPVSPKPQPLSKTFSSFFKKRIEKQPTKNINVLMEFKTNHPLLKLQKVNYSNSSVIYYHQKKILKLSLEERAAAISQYLLNMHLYKKDNIKCQLSNPIEPCQKKIFNGDLCVDFIPDLPEEEEPEITVTTKNIETDSPAKENSYVSTRPKRVVKRKNYVDQITDDEDDFTVSKKTKSNDDLSSNNECSPESKWITKKKKSLSKAPLYMSTGSDRINKIFDKLKWGDSESTEKPLNTETKSTAENLQETLDLSDSDEELFPTRELVTVNIHKEDNTVKNKNGKMPKAKKTSPKKRATYNKLAIQKKSATKENESPEISTQNFYAKNSDVDESNNNKLENNEELTNCPICNHPFHVSKIEVHASNCMQYEGKEFESFCDICNKLISDKKFLSHRYECLQKLTEESCVVDKPVTRSQRNTTNGFLCNICDKYISNMSEIQHASNCSVVDKPVTSSQRNTTNGFLCHICDKYIYNTSEIQHASNCIAKV